MATTTDEAVMVVEVEVDKERGEGQRAKFF